MPDDATSAGWLDVDNDGLVDLLVFRAEDDPLVLHNLNGTFDEASASVWPAGAGLARAAAFVDLDADSFVDVLLLGPSQLRAFRNGNGSFTPFASGFNNTVTGSAAAAGDVDDSGQQDVVVAGDQGVSLLINARSKSLRAATTTGLPTQAVWSAALIDYDLDGFLDVVAVLKAGGLALYRNLGTGSFTPILSADSGLPDTGEWRGLALGDFDNDGRTDLLASRLDAPAVAFHNGDTSGHFFKVDPTGVQSNHDGIGARIVASGERLLLERYVLPGASGLSTSAPEIVFGLGAGGVTSLRIQWPSGTFQDQRVPAGNTTDRILFANEEASRSEWGDNAC